jgi:YbgC/YbaW family acyl-CoA thioester hydrolase
MKYKGTVLMNQAPKRGRLIVRKMLIEPDFHQVDMMGVAHNAAYFHWFEKGRLALLWEMLPFDEAMELRLALPVIRHECDYRTATRYGDRLILTTTHEIQAQYEGRLIFEHSLVHETNKTEIARAITALTIMDMESKQLIREFPVKVWERYQSLK